jgi:uncharacterized protein
VVWGGRTLASSHAPLEPIAFVAHRRFVHRLVRAIQRVALPLVFEPNGPVLSLLLVREITELLLAAYRAGALRGERPEQAFSVECKPTPDEVDSGLCVCTITAALARPMEHVRIDVTVRRDGTLEVA